MTLHSYYGCDKPVQIDHRSFAMNIRERAGKLTALDDYLIFDNKAIITRTSDSSYNYDFILEGVVQDKPFRLSYKLQPHLFLGMGQFNSNREEALIVSRNDALRIYVYKPPVFTHDRMTKTFFWKLRQDRTTVEPDNAPFERLLKNEEDLKTEMIRLQLESTAVRVAWRELL